MSTFASKKPQQQFSTTDFCQNRDHNRTYSSRFSRTKPKKATNLLSTLPSQQQKSAIKIQRWWRFRMSMRRLFYENLLEELYYDNQVMNKMIEVKEKYLQGVINENQNIEAFFSLEIQKRVKENKNKMLRLAKDCIGIQFKLEKRMLSTKELENVEKEKREAVIRIQKLKKAKQELQQELIEKSNKEEQMYLKQIKEVNSQLLKIVAQRNSLKQKIKQKIIDREFPTIKQEKRSF